MSETVPGGYYLDPGGKSAHDANGNKIPLRPEPVIEPEQVETPVEPTASAPKPKVKKVQVAEPPVEPLAPDENQKAE